MENIKQGDRVNVPSVGDGTVWAAIEGDDLIVVALDEGFWNEGRTAFTTKLVAHPDALDRIEDEAIPEAVQLALGELGEAAMKEGDACYFHIEKACEYLRIVRVPA